MCNMLHIMLYRIFLSSYSRPNYVYYMLDVDDDDILFCYTYTHIILFHYRFSMLYNKLVKVGFSFSHTNFHVSQNTYQIMYIYLP